MYYKYIYVYLFIYLYFYIYLYICIYKSWTSTPACLTDPASWVDYLTMQHIYICIMDKMMIYIYVYTKLGSKVSTISTITSPQFELCHSILLERIKNIICIYIYIYISNCLRPTPPPRLEITVQAQESIKLGCKIHEVGT